MFESPIDLSGNDEPIFVAKKPRLSNGKVGFDGKAYKECYFSLVKDNTWKCHCGNNVNQNTKNGYSNLIKHVQSFHPNYEIELQRWIDSKIKMSGQRTLLDLGIHEKALSIYDWIDIVIRKGLNLYYFND